MKNFKELKVWEKSHQLVLQIYRITKKFPSDELFGLTSQLRRAVASIPANIAEGCGRRGDRELIRFLGIASGSASETEYHLLLAHDLQYIDSNSYTELNEKINEVKKMLHGFITYLKSPKT